MRYQPMIRLATLAVALATGLTLAGCAGSAPVPDGATGTPVKDGTLRIAVGADLGTYDPYQSSIIMQYMLLAYDPLVHIGADGEILSGLATSWEGDSNGMTFTLGDDRVCSDGTAMTASVVKEAFDFVLDPENGASLFGTYTPSVPVEVIADDSAGTVEVIPEQPFGFLAQTLGNLPVVCPAGLADREQLATSSLGSGPFVLSDVVVGDHYTFTRNDDYTWGPDGATTSEIGIPKTLILQVVENETTATNLLLGGEVQIARALGENADRIRNAGLASVDRTLVSGEIWYNQEASRVGSDIVVRQALTEALDRDALVGLSAGGSGGPAVRLVELGAPICTAETVPGMLPDFDEQAAGKTLDQAGWKLGADGIRSKDGVPLEIDFHYVNFKGDATVAAAEYTAELWKNIGVSVNLQGDTAAQMSEAMFATGNWDVYWNGFNFQRPDAVIPWVSGEAPPNGQNFAYIENSEYVAAVNDAFGLEGSAGCDQWGAAEQALFTNFDLIPISNEITPTFMKNAEISYLGGSIMPMSLRVLEGE